jgi:hypothetical protein
MRLKPNTEAAFLDEIQTKVLPKSFPPCYSKSPLLHCLGISISSYSNNLLCISSNSRSCTVYLKEKGGKPDRKLYPLHCGLRKKPQVWELSRLCPETSTKLHVHEFGFSRGRTAWRKGCIKNTYSDKKKEGLFANSVGCCTVYTVQRVGVKRLTAKGEAVQWAGEAVQLAGEAVQRAGW